MATYEDAYAEGAEKAAARKGYEEGYDATYGKQDTSFNWKGFAEGVANQGFQWLDREIANDAAVRRSESLKRVELDFANRGAGSGWASESGVELTNDQVEQRGGTQGLTTMFNQVQKQKKAERTAATQAEIEAFEQKKEMRAMAGQEKTDQAVDQANAVGNRELTFREKLAQSRLDATDHDKDINAFQKESVAYAAFVKKTQDAAVKDADNQGLEGADRDNFVRASVKDGLAASRLSEPVEPKYKSRLSNKQQFAAMNSPEDYNNLNRYEKEIIDNKKKAIESAKAKSKANKASEMNVTSDLLSAGYSAVAPSTPSAPAAPAAPSAPLALSGPVVKEEAPVEEAKQELVEAKDTYEQAKAEVVPEGGGVIFQRGNPVVLNANGKRDKAATAKLQKVYKKFKKSESVFNKASSKSNRRFQGGTRGEETALGGGK